MYVLEKYREKTFDEDIYITRIRSGYAHLMLNAGYDGIHLLDCVSGEIVKTIAFPEFDFSIYTWVVTPDGRTSYLFSPDETDYALEIDLEQEKAKKIALVPDFEAPTHLCWFSPNLHILDYHYTVWVLRDDALVKADAKTADAHYTREFRRLTKRFVVVKMAPETNGVYVRSREYDVKHMGRISLANDTELLMEQDGLAIDVTHYGSSLFTAFEFQIVQFRDGQTRPELTAPEARFFVSVNVIEHQGVGYLNILSSSEEHLTGAEGTVTVYKLREQS
jgi:hypothetical protein